MKISNPRTFANEPLLTAASGVQAVAILPTPSASTDGKTYLLTGTGHLYYGVANGNTHSLSDITPSCSCAAALAALEARVAALEEGATPTTGTLVVNYTGDAPSGAKWSADSGSTWNDFGDSLTLAAGNYTVSYKSVSGYTAPSSDSATVSAGQTTTITAGSYTVVQQTFLLTVNYSGVTIPTGAQWSADGGTTWNNFNSSISLPTPGTYTVSYKAVSGYTAPDSHSFTASGTDSVVFYKNYTEITYPNAFVVSGLPTNVDTRHAQYNGTYTKTASTTTANGASYPIYSNGVNYLYLKYNNGYYNAYITDLAADAVNNYSNYYLHHTSAEAAFSGFNAAWLAGTWTEYTPTGMDMDDYTLSITESSSTTPSAGQYSDPEDEPTTPTDQYLEISGCSTSAMNGKYYFITGNKDTAPASSGAPNVWLRHENGHYYISYYYGGSSRYWLVQNTNSVNQWNEPNGSPQYSLGGNMQAVSTAFDGGVTVGTITTTYVDSTVPVVSNTPYLNVAGSGADTYNGNYILYSGQPNEATSVWKHQTENYYIRRLSRAGTPAWGITDASDGTTNLATISDDNPSVASSCFANGLTYNGYKTTYNDGSTPAASGTHLSVFSSPYGFGNADYYGDYYLTSGQAGSTASVWTRWDGAYQIKESSFWYIYNSGGSTQLAQISWSGEGAPSSWGTGIEYNGYKTVYHAS